MAKCVQIIPPSDGSLHKGQAGRVGVVGGSRDYTGAPFYSSYAALRLGADLAHVVCEPVASTVIKTYSPDLIVHSFLSSPGDENEYATHQKEFEALLDRLHVLVIGPGLGRDDDMQNWAKWAIEKARERGLGLVLDADALWLVQTKPDVVRNYPQAVLTPNHVEFQRLLKACSIKDDGHQTDLATRLSTALGGCTILQKAAADIIARDGSEPITIDCEGSPKRCGGQGDVLSGVVGTWLAWGKCYYDRQKQNPNKLEDEMKITPEEIPLIAASVGAEVTRTCSKLAYSKFGRSMQTSDMLGFVGESFEEVVRGLSESNLRHKI